MASYRVVYQRKGESKVRPHISKPVSSLTKAQKIADDMNGEAQFFRWNKHFFVQKAEYGEWEDV